ncbi:MAG: cytochrome C assembly family protein [bacterium]
MLTTTTGIICITLYLVAAIYQGMQIRLHPSLSKTPVILISAIALLLLGLSAWRSIFAERGVDLGFFSASIGILFTVNLVLFVSGLRRELSILAVPFFLLTSAGLALILLLDTPLPTEQHLPLNIGIHVGASILAYSLLTIATVQALMLAYQNRLLHHKQLDGWIRAMPPLEVMESLLFELIWAGFILLSASLLTGFFFVENFLAQHLAHKTFFSVLGWLFYAILLWGHHRQGWRGKTAVRWTIGGFAALIFAFWGTKLVLEFILVQ